MTKGNGCVSWLGTLDNTTNRNPHSFWKVVDHGYLHSEEYKD